MSSVLASPTHLQGTTLAKRSSWIAVLLQLRSVEGLGLGLLYFQVFPLLFWLSLTEPSSKSQKIANSLNSQNFRSLKIPNLQGHQKSGNGDWWCKNKEGRLLKCWDSFLVGEQLCCISALVWALLSAFYFPKPRRNEGNTSRMHLLFFSFSVICAFLICAELLFHCYPSPWREDSSMWVLGAVSQQGTRTGWRTFVEYPWANHTLALAF